MWQFHFAEHKRARNRIAGHQTQQAQMTEEELERLQHGSYCQRVNTTCPFHCCANLQTTRSKFVTHPDRVN
jgi:hypothetical protein